MPGIPSLQQTYAGRRVLITGHTGFKGSWLALWLESLGAQVTGLSLPARTDSLYSRAQLHGRWTEALLDLREFPLVQDAVTDLDPELVFHLAAQPLVDIGFDDPLGTFTTNVIGTANVLEALRTSGSTIGCVVVTTDKVYLSSVEPRRYRETDSLGGTDPYSASKAAAEHVVAAWKSVLEPELGIRVIAARAGNVIGGGDATEGRLLPDLIRAFSSGEPARLRQPSYTRPWQHVLDPLHGYLKIGARIITGDGCPPALNFGPADEWSVKRIADLVTETWGTNASWISTGTSSLSEASFLSLDSSLARESIGWEPTWSTPEAIRRTVTWWQSCFAGVAPVDLCLQDIRDFMSEHVDGLNSAIR